MGKRAGRSSTRAAIVAALLTITGTGYGAWQSWQSVMEIRELSVDTPAAPARHADPSAVHTLP